MRNLLFTVVIACTIIATWGLANGYTGITGNLAAVETSTAVLDHQDWSEETNQLDGRVRGVYGNLRVASRCEGYSDPGTARYSGLTPRGDTSPYEGITSGVYGGGVYGGGVYESLTLRNIGPKEEVIIIEAGDRTPVSKKTRLTPVVQVAEHDCECGRVCKCPPLVCEGGYCNANYAIVFASKTCAVCPQMWPVIKELREDGYIVFYVETDNHPGILERLGIQVWPTTFVMENKRPKIRFRGVTTAEKIAEHLKTRKQQRLTTDRGKL